MRKLLVGVFVALALTTPVSPVYAQLVTAKSTESLIDSIGVNLHLGYTDRVYNDFAKIKAALLDIGIRHYRDGLEKPNFKQYIKNRHNELGRAGLRGTFLSSATPVQDLAAAEQVSDSLEAFEGQNEILNIYVKWDDAKRDAARLHQRELYKAVKASPRWRDYPVIGPSAVGEAGYKALGDLSPYMDFGNAHAYPLGFAPAVPESNYFKELEAANFVAPGKRIFVTETGYQTGNNKEGNQRVSLAASGKYAPRLFLENFNRGIVRSFWYEFINQGTGDGQESNFGLLFKDFTLKPSGRAVKNLIALLKDADYNAQTRKWESPNPAFVPHALDFALEGATANVHTTLLQKSNGKFYLCLWQEVSSYNIANNVEADIAVPPVAVSLKLKTPVSAAVLHTLGGDVPAASPLPVVKSQIAVAVPDEVVIVELTPKIATPKKPAPKKTTGQKKAAPKAAAKSR